MNGLNITLEVNKDGIDDIIEYFRLNKDREVKVKKNPIAPEC
jgi:hypothetical protein